MAQERDGIVINADASQLYRDLPILSARPDPAEEALAPHRLYGVMDGADACSAAEWAALARAAIEDAWTEGRLPILVGGTGLYLRTLIEGIAPVPDIDPAIRAAVRAMAAVDARTALEGEDPAMAARLHPNDSQRNSRALEVVRATGRSLGWWQARTEGGMADRATLLPAVIVPDRQALYARADSRFVAMMERGALPEVEALRARGLSPGLPVMKTLGVRPLLAHLAGEMPLSDAIAAAQLETRQYAKRQFTWFVGGGQARGWLAAAKKIQG